jgi:hypothetical protein
MKDQETVQKFIELRLPSSSASSRRPSGIAPLPHLNRKKSKTGPISVSFGPIPTPIGSQHHPKSGIISTIGSCVPEPKS